MCHIHKGGATGIIPPSDEIDEVKILKKLARDSDPRVRLRAVDLLLEQKRRGDEASSPVESREAVLHAFLKALTDEERARLIEILGTLRAFKETVYERRPDLRPHPVAEIIVPEPVESREAVLHEEAPPPVEAPQSSPAEQSSTEPEPYVLPRERYADVGLCEVNGTVTHPLGDDHAQRILSGEIPYDDARDQQQDAMRSARAMAGATS